MSLRARLALLFGLLTAAGIAALLVLGTVISTWLAIERKEALDDAVFAEARALDLGETARKDHETAQFRLADELMAERDPGRGVAILAGLLRKDSNNRVAAMIMGKLLNAKIIVALDREFRQGN